MSQRDGHHVARKENSYGEYDRQDQRAPPLVLVNACFVAAEFALVNIRSARLEQLAVRGHLWARVALGITLASLALGWIGEPAFAGLLKPLCASHGVWSVPTAHAVAVITIFAAITFLHTVLGELAPKSLAIQRTEPVALWTATPLRVFSLVMFPVIWTLNTASWLVLRLCGLQRACEVEMLHAPEELRLILQRVALEPGTRRVIDRLFDSTHRAAQHVMTLRRDVVVLDAGRSWDENLAVALAQQYTRSPLVASETDGVLGSVHLQDIVAVLGAHRRPGTWIKSSEGIPLCTRSVSAFGVDFMRPSSSVWPSILRTADRPPRATGVCL
jgi:CBS domain containing-hemolysin-like protein